jgi:diacylglycerol kinase family enzyme
VLICLAASVAAALYGVGRRGAARTVGLAGAALLAVAAVVLVIVERRLLEDLLIVAGALGAVTAARLAFRVHMTLVPAPRPGHAVLFYNPKSGGGKATKFHLADEARSRGIEPIELRLGDDLERLVRAAVDGGADALAMAGGDGSQAIVAKVAAELGLPYACIPAGTRNHFALDLGVDRDDVVGALDALVDGGERRVDLAEVGGRVFVNNVSLGLYAEAVQRPGYREAKLHTLLDTVPDTLGPDAAASGLLCQTPSGQVPAVAVLVSNNRYRLRHVLGLGTRPRVDQGVLGIAALLADRDGDPGSGRRRARLEQWTASALQIDSDAPVPAGIDGEAATLDAPLRFVVRPGALRVRIAPAHPGASPSALVPDRPGQVVQALVRLAFAGAVRGTPPPQR